MKILSENELLDPAIRKKLIEHFHCSANQRRKAEAFKGYECLKDHTNYYVMRDLLNQFDLETVEEMQYSISNISILRKVIDKLARVYSNGVKRTIGNNEKATKSVEDAANLLKMNTAMKKVDRYYRTFKNTLLYIRPQVEEDDKYSVRLEVKAPFNYDIVEHPDDCTKPLAVILSDYAPTRPTLYYLGDAAVAGREGKNTRVVREDDMSYLAQSYSPSNDKTNGNVNDKKDNREFIWWTPSYHFTTNVKGELIPDKSDDGQNPIGELPFVNFSGDQDNGFWADGGSDLIDAGVKINTMLTNADAIGVSQGFGQLYMTGKNLPKKVKVGPNVCVQLEHEKDDPDPKIGYLNSNPPLDALKNQIEMEVALMLSTNSLSTSNFSTTLKGGQGFPSGIALMIDKSESIEDIKDQAQIFIDNEPLAWVKIGLWLDYFKSAQALSEEFRAVKLPSKDLKSVQLTFPAPAPIQSESEELDNIKKRKDLSLNTDVELIMRDNPGMTEEEAQEKLDKIKEEKKTNAEEFAQTAKDLTNGGNSDQKGGGLPQANGVNPGSKPKPEAPGSGTNPNQK